MAAVGEFLQPGLYAKAPSSANETLKSVLGGEGIEWANISIAVVVLLLTTVVVLKAFNGKKGKNTPPEIPGGFPILGNLFQMREAKPYRTFRDWSFKYGPIFTIKTGSISSVVVNNSELCKEVLVTKHSSITSRKHYTGMQVLTDKRIVAMSDYGPEHLKLKKAYVSHLLAPGIQKSNRLVRERNLKLWIDTIMATVSGKESQQLNFTDLFRQYLYTFAMDQVYGYVPDNVFVPDFGRHVGKAEMYDLLVQDILTNVVSIDYRNFFPRLSFLGNKSLDRKLNSVVERRASLMDALIEQQRKLIEQRGPTLCYADVLLTQYADWGPLQLRMSMWEPIIEGVDSTLVTVEWALFEIVRNPDIQARLYEEIKSVVGDRMVTEDDMDKMPLLKACIQETLRMYSPLPLLPPRYVHEDITLGGYDIPKGTDILVNLHAVNTDPNTWEDPLKWNPDRLLGDEKLDMGVSDYRLLPFGGGKRICRGITQVLVVMPLLVSTLLLHFELTQPPQTQQEKEAEQNTKILTTHKLLPLIAIATPRVGSRIKFPEAVEMNL